MAGFAGHDGAAITEGDQGMRSLWRALAVQWLGGKGSEALTGASALLDMLGTEKPERTFDVRREPGVSHHAMMVSSDRTPNLEAAVEDAVRNRSGG